MARNKPQLWLPRPLQLTNRRAEEKKMKTVPIYLQTETIAEVPNHGYSKPVCHKGHRACIKTEFLGTILQRHDIASSHIQQNTNYSGMCPTHVYNFGIMSSHELCILGKEGGVGCAYYRGGISVCSLKINFKDLFLKM